METHFDQNAGDYNNSRKRGFLRRIVLAENKAVLSLLKPKKKEHILDAGCGQGMYTELIKTAGGKVVGIDLSEAMVKQYAYQGNEGVQGTMEKLPFKPVFDKVLCGGSMEFVGNPKKVLEEYQRVLKKKGMLVWLYPHISICGLLYVMYHKNHGVDIHLFSNSEIKQLLIETGFTILQQEKGSVLSKVILAVKK